MTTQDTSFEKRLASLIDETLAELDELKKSDRFSASEIKIEGPGAGIAGKPSDGAIEKDEDKEEEDEDEKKKKEDMEKEEDEKDEDKESDEKKDEMDKAEKSPKAMKKEEKKDDEDEKEEEKKEEEKEMKKSLKASESLMKSYIDSRISPIESKLETIMSLVKDIANSPVPSRGVSYKNLAPLKKSDSETESLTKSQVVDKLFDLKKSGTRVDTLDIASAELGTDLAKIMNKYNIK